MEHHMEFTRKMILYYIFGAVIVMYFDYVRMSQPCQFRSDRTHGVGPKLVDSGRKGQISQKSVMRSLSECHQPFENQIPWKFCQQFQDSVFPSLSGVQIVCIAVHPSALRLGYGSTAVELLTSYYEGQMTQFTEEDADPEDIKEPEIRVTEAAEKTC